MRGSAVAQAHAVLGFLSCNQCKALSMCERRHKLQSLQGEGQHSGEWEGLDGPTGCSAVLVAGCELQAARLAGWALTQQPFWKLLPPGHPRPAGIQASGVAWTPVPKPLFLCRCCQNHCRFGGSAKARSQVLEAQHWVISVRMCVRGTATRQARPG